MLEFEDFLITRNNGAYRNTLLIFQISSQQDVLCRKSVFTQSLSQILKQCIGPQLMCEFFDVFL